MNKNWILKIQIIVRNKRKIDFLKGFGLFSLSLAFNSFFFLLFSGQQENVGTMSDLSYDTFYEGASMENWN